MLYASTRYLVAKVICRTKQRRAVESIELVYVRRTWLYIYIYIYIHILVYAMIGYALRYLFTKGKDR